MGGVMRGSGSGGDVQSDLQIYLREINRTALLTVEEERRYGAARFVFLRRSES